MCCLVYMRNSVRQAESEAIAQSGQSEKIEEFCANFLSNFCFSLAKVYPTRKYLTFLYYFYFFIVVQVQFSTFFPHPSPAPQPPSLPHLPPISTPLHCCPCVLYNCSCKPFTLFLLKSLPSPLCSLSACFQFQCFWLYFASLIVFLIRFLLKVISYGSICLSTPGLFHIA